MSEELQKCLGMLDKCEQDEECASHKSKLNATLLELQERCAAGV